MTVLIQGSGDPGVALVAKRMLAYGTRVEAGVKSQSQLPHPDSQLNFDYPFPLFSLVEEAIAKIGPIDASILCVQAEFLLDAALEAIDAGIPMLILLTAQVPPLASHRLIRAAHASQTFLLGPQSAGIILPGQVLLGSHPCGWYRPGAVGLLSISQGLGFEVAAYLSARGLGQSCCINLGSDPLGIVALEESFRYLTTHPQTKVIGVVGPFPEEAFGQLQEWAQQTTLPVLLFQPERVEVDASGSGRRDWISSKKRSPHLEGISVTYELKHLEEQMRAILLNPPD
ncbi:MAG: CoA-binding protein [Synechococcaceae cyanobacterium SM2_3_1]|nr:CoA-binding protein [Synechococcaceae cyanobacterium SM2_3_1]